MATDTTNTLAADRFRVDFPYDGQGRRRVKKDCVWGPGQWHPKGETRYVYGGLLIGQKRNDANTPLVTYTRGHDLSVAVEERVESGVRAVLQEAGPAEPGALRFGTSAFSIPPSAFP